MRLPQLSDLGEGGVTCHVLLLPFCGCVHSATVIINKAQNSCSTFYVVMRVIMCIYITRFPHFIYHNDVLIYCHFSLRLWLPKQTLNKL